jgi:hypothetical protein
MGLLYLFPTDTSDDLHCVKDETSLTLRSYGLPPIFWGYAGAIIAIVIALFLAVQGPLVKLYSYGSSVDIVIVYGLISLIVLSLLTLISFFFYEKQIQISKDQVSLNYRLFGLTLKRKRFALNQNTSWQVIHFIDSPNMARMQGSEASRGFQNKGYFELYLHIDGVKHFIDRHSRKADLEKMKRLFESFNN